MKKTVKMILALTLVLVLTLGLGVTSYAAETLTDGVADHTANDDEHASNSVRILKELVIYNEDSAKIYLPTVTYTYSIEPFDDSGSVIVTDVNGEDLTVPVYYEAGTSADWALQTTSATVSFSPDTTYTSIYKADGSLEANTWVQPLTAADDGTSVYGAFEIEFDPDNYPHAGVYRYVIEQTDSHKDLCGIEDGDDTVGIDDYNTRYLDVYVRGVDRDDDGEYDTYEIYGYVCFGISGNILYDDVYSTFKTDGFVHEDDDLSSLADQYFTCNLVVGKTISGGHTAKTHAFPFIISFDNGSLGTPNRILMQLALGRTETSDDLKTSVSLGSVRLNDNTSSLGSYDGDNKIDAVTCATITANLSDGDHINLNGFPAAFSAVIAVKENNDSYDVYLPSVEITGKTGDKLNLYSTEDPEHDWIYNLPGNGDTLLTFLQRDDWATTVGYSGSGNQRIWFTNELIEVSPTGVVVRYAPYALILGAALVLLFLARRRDRDAA